MRMNVSKDATPFFNPPWHNQDTTIMSFNGCNIKKKKKKKLA